ncbi:MAG: HNH endonuclease, partial [Bdellovibrionales bacterium]|nr:HNH endonuclease [Bdellovibrionales bacterium]
IDHVRPQALGGSSAPQNLRVLCRSCNQRAAIKVFGQTRMDRYLSI